MKIKKFLADSMPDAMKQITRELGKDAVILNQKEIFVGGFLGMFRKRKFEVIAARDPQPAQNAQSAQNAARDMLSSVLQQAANNGSIAAFDAARILGSSMPQPAAVDPYNQMAVGGSASPIISQIPTAPVNVAAQFYNQSKSGQMSAQAVMSQQPMKQTSNVAVEKVVESTDQSKKPDNVTDPNLLQEIRQMREMLKTMKQERQLEELPPALMSIRDRLVDQEIDEQIVNELTRAMMEDASINLKDESSAVSILKSMKQRLTALLQTSVEPAVTLTDYRVIHFVGPTGVGKTTTLAKLAAEQVLKNKKKVGFITSDTYRISAVDQLKTYASILNVPIEVVNSPTDLPKAMKNLEDCDLVFMDTAGRNFRNSLYVSELNNLLKQSQNSLTFLVLSLTTKYKDMKAIASNFSAFKIDRVLFTKIDETESYGSIVNIIREFDLPPSYIANGQNVPNDIYPFDKHKIVELILGERSE